MHGASSSLYYQERKEDQPMKQPVLHSCDMDVLTAIETRRSIRRYTGEPVSEEMLHTLLHAGFCAPSAKNCRPWEFVVVRSRDKLKCFSEHAQYQKMAEHAAFAIVVCGDTRRLDHHDLLLNDCSAAVENILLAAHGLGLGAVWCGIVNELVNFFRQQLSLPEEVLPVALVAVGHPAEERPVPERYDPSHVHFEAYQSKN